MIIIFFNFTDYSSILYLLEKQEKEFSIETNKRKKKKFSDKFSFEFSNISEKKLNPYSEGNILLEEDQQKLKVQSEEYDINIESNFFSYFNILKIK